MDFQAAPALPVVGQRSKHSPPAPARRSCRGCRRAPGRSAAARGRVSVGPRRREDLGAMGSGPRGCGDPGRRCSDRPDDRKSREPAVAPSACASATDFSFRAPQAQEATKLAQLNVRTRPLRATPNRSVRTESRMRFQSAAPSTPPCPWPFAIERRSTTPAPVVVRPVADIPSLC